MICISERKTTIRTPTLAEFFSFGDFITRLFAEAFLKASNKEAAYKKMTAIVSSLAEIQNPLQPSPHHCCANWEAISCIGRFMKREDILRLGGKPQFPPDLWNYWLSSGEDSKHTGDRARYDDMITKQAEMGHPTIPNMHAEIKSGDKLLSKQPDTVDGLVNWGKFRKLASKCKLLIQFQNQGYSFVPIPQIQKLILKGPDMTPAQIEEKLDEQVRLLPKD
jgi:hypothetical protein